jgi:hypothetical protein
MDTATSAITVAGVAASTVDIEAATLVDIEAATLADIAAGSASVGTGADTPAVIVAASESAATTGTRAAIAAGTPVESAAEQQAAASVAEFPADFMVAGVVAPTAVVDTGNPQPQHDRRPAPPSRPSCFRPKKLPF